MLRTLEGMPDGVLGFEAGDKLTTADFTEVLAPALESALAGGGRLRVVLVFPTFGGMEPGGLWQDLKLGIRDWNAWERIALAD